MTDNDMPQTGLIYNGTEVRAVGDRLNLTDMWKASGSPSGRAPSDWSALTSSKEFISHVELIAGISGNELVHVVRGGKSPRTEAHWQIGLAYAKYLSPEFHMWCNTVVRERMEGKSVGISDANELVRRIDGIARSTIHKVTGVEKVLAMMANAMEEQDRRINGLILSADGRVAALEYVSVRELLTEAGATQKGRNGVNRKVGRELRNRALLSRPPTPVRKCPHSGVWLFPRDFAAVYMAERGKSLVKAHNDRIAGQGALKLVQIKAIKPSEGEARP